jgi:hypothetical protein
MSVRKLRDEDPVGAYARVLLSTVPERDYQSINYDTTDSVPDIYLSFALAFRSLMPPKNQPLPGETKYALIREEEPILFAGMPRDAVIYATSSKIRPAENKYHYEVGMSLDYNDDKNRPWSLMFGTSTANDGVFRCFSVRANRERGVERQGWVVSENPEDVTTFNKLIKQYIGSQLINPLGQRFPK